MLERIKKETEIEKENCHGTSIYGITFNFIFSLVSTPFIYIPTFYFDRIFTLTCSYQS